MPKKIIFTLLFIIPWLFYNSHLSFAAQKTSADDYLCEIGIGLYRTGRYDEALTEFKKALMVNPANKTAKEYVNNFFTKTQGGFAPQKEAAPLPKEKISPEAAPVVKPKEPVSPKQPTVPAPAVPPQQVNAPAKRAVQKELTPPQPSRDEAIMLALDMQEGHKFPEEAEIDILQREYIAAQAKKGAFKVTGDVQMGVGLASPDDFYWKRASYDLNERNWRMLDHNALNRGFNTYDPRIYDSLDLDLDTSNKEGFNFHGNITVDPWSFTGKSPKMTVTSTSGDTVELEFKYWSNMGYTVNETMYTGLKGNSINLPEIKVRNGKIDTTTVFGKFSGKDPFSIPATKIIREFQPIRELWADYSNDTVTARAFPIAYQDQAYTSDDPLAITNHHIWWQDSLWLYNYQGGIFNSGATPVDFTKGAWDDHLTFLSRDSDGTYLTALRGFSFNFQPQEETSFSVTAATPKNLWQNYEIADNAMSASRLKHALMPNLDLGATFTTRTAFHKGVDNNNFVEGFDLGYEIIEGLKAFGEVLGSQSYYDQSDETYKTEARGNGYYFSIIGRYPRESIMDLTYGYDEIKLGKNEVFLLKGKFYGSHMDHGFNSALSTFRNTRDDQFWGRHITFRQPFAYYYSGLKYPGLKWDDINAIRIGDGIDYGRNVIGMRLEAICDKKYHNLFDARNVHDVNGKYIENVARDELTVYFGDKLTTKGLLLYQDKHLTYGGIDPFIFDSATGDFVKDWSSNPIDDGQDPSLTTGSLGLEYAFFDWLRANGVWEITNDYSLAYANFPRSVLSDDQLARIYYEEGRKYRGDQLYLYDQQLFPQPPYPFYNIFKTGLRLALSQTMELYLDYTRNAYEIAGQNSDNMNHIGLEFSFMPNKKLGMLFKYNYSRWKDLDRLRAGITEPRGHHNFYTAFRYLPSEFDELIMEYGEGNVSPIGNITYDPHGGSLTTIDTQHIFRFYYRRKF
jgi:tetratricopeptide (TPR) repeat protein